MISINTIFSAADAIDPIFTNTPQYRSESLSAQLNCGLIIKDECRNPIGSFKGRGVDWWMQTHPRIEEVICASAGNFGQAAAYVGRRLNKKITVFAAETANPAKVDAMSRLGATVIQHGVDFDAAKVAALDYAQCGGGYYLEDGKEADISHGAGSIGVELSRYPDPIDILFIPIGNGALLGGIATWFKAVSPTTKIVGVCAVEAPAMALSLQEKSVISTPTANTIADGIAIREPIPESLPPLEHTVDDILLVTEAEIVDAMRLYFQTENLVTEPAGAVSLAAALQIKEEIQGLQVVTLACGANIDPSKRAQWLLDA